MEHRHLDYPPETPVDGLGPAALDDLLDRGDLEAWAPLARAILADPHGELADTVLGLCDAHPMYGTSVLWRTWIQRLREERSPRERSLGDLRRERGLTQAEVGERMGISQSDVSKVERRSDVRVSTLRAYVEATGGRLELRVRYPDDGDQATLRMRKGQR